MNKNLTYKQQDNSVSYCIQQDKFKLDIQWQFEKVGVLTVEDKNELKNIRSSICQTLSDMLECDTL